MAFNNPKGNEKSKFGFAVGRPGCVLGDTLCVLDHLTLTGLDVPDEVSRRILLAFPCEGDRRVSELKNVRLRLREKKM